MGAFLGQLQFCTEASEGFIDRHGAPGFRVGDATGKRGVERLQLRGALTFLEIALAHEVADIFAVGCKRSPLGLVANELSAVTLEDAAAKPETDLEEEIVGKEGRLLTRIHAYKGRDRVFAARAKKNDRDKNGGKLTCEACGLNPVVLYGPDGERCIEAHHKVPIEELQPDSITRVDEMAMVCASCHRIIHSRKPCLTIAEVKKAS